jgi:hypothetical protein
MTRVQYLLVKIAEEAAEVAQRATKAVRFGLGEVQPGQSLDNSQRLRAEMLDLRAAVQALDDATSGAFGFTVEPDDDQITARLARIEKYLAYSVMRGQVAP